MNQMEIEEWNNEIKPFLQQWLSNLFNGLMTQSEDSRSEILKHCGLACAHPQANVFFQEAWKKTSNLDSFLSLLNKKYCREVFTQRSRKTISVKYDKCYCPLRQLNLVDSSLLGICARFWLKEVFESALNVSVNVQTKQTICNDGKQCNFLIHLVDKENLLLDYQTYIRDILKLKNDYFSD
jgi:hypothetical protein